MSRIAKSPVILPQGVSAQCKNGCITVTGAKGTLSQSIHPYVSLNIQDNLIQVSPIEQEDMKFVWAIAGTSRALIKNMVIGVSDGYEHKLLLVGVGYRAKVQGNQLELTLGFSHPVAYDIPKGVTIEMLTPTELVVRGIDKQLVGQVAANIRRYRSPDAYKGKGVRYANETIILKEVKKK